jgi:hypothetical protein
LSEEYGKMSCETKVYEYRYIRNSAKFSEMEKKINGLMESGWELISVAGISNVFFVYWFRRWTGRYVTYNPNSDFVNDHLKCG